MLWKMQMMRLAPANSQAGVYQVLENWLEKEG